MSYNLIICKKKRSLFVKNAGNSSTVAGLLVDTLQGYTPEKVQPTATRSKEGMRDSLNANFSQWLKINTSRSMDRMQTSIGLRSGSSNARLGSNYLDMKQSLIEILQSLLLHFDMCFYRLIIDLLF